MPLLTIHSLPPADETIIPKLVAEVRLEGARALKCPPTNIWVMFVAIPPGWYAQGEAPARVPQEQSYPPCVIVRAQAGRSREELSALASTVATMVGKHLAIPADNVWIHYQEMRSEDVWYGGRWSK